MLMQSPPPAQVLALSALLRATTAYNMKPWIKQPGISPAPKRGYEWRIIGEEKLVHTFVRNGRVIPKLITSPIMTLTEKPGRKYTSEKIQQLERERGCGKVGR